MLPAEAGFLGAPSPHCLLPDGADVLSQAMYFEATANLTGDMLVKVDRMSMANSLEVRCPLLDHGLAELAATIPHAWKIAHGRGKQILRKAGRPSAAGASRASQEGLRRAAVAAGSAVRSRSFSGTT